MHRIYHVYGGEKQFFEVVGGHNSSRPPWFFDRAATYINYHCAADEIVEIPHVYRGGDT
jgi:hypothetical protein